MLITSGVVPFCEEAFYFDDAGRVPNHFPLRSLASFVIFLLVMFSTIPRKRNRFPLSFYSRLMKGFVLGVVMTGNAGRLRGGWAN